MKYGEGRGNIIRESEIVDVAEEVTEQLEQQAAPGVYLAGKRLLGTTATAMDQMTLHFEGDWDLQITGVFKLTMLDAPDLVPAEAEEEEAIIGEVTHEEDDAIDEGLRLMGGHQ